MTEDRFRELYNAARSAYQLSRSWDGSIRRHGQEQLDKTLDLLIDESDPIQAGQVDWAIDNGYPEFETVQRYGVTAP